MGWVDIIFIAILVLFSVIGLCKGLFESLLSIFGTVLSLFIAIWVSKPVAAFLNKIVDVNGFFLNLLTKWNIIAEDGLVHMLGKTFSGKQAAEFCSIVLSVILVWLLIKLAVLLLAKLFDSATSNSSALSGLNRVFGLVFGLAKGFLISCIGFAIISGLNIFGITKGLVTEIQEKNKMSGFVYKYVNEFVANELDKRLDDLVGESVPATTESKEQENKNTMVVSNPVENPVYKISSVIDNLHLGTISIQ